MKVKNKITTPGYFIKRLRDSGFVVIRLFSDYPIHDPRKWTVMVDPGGHCLQITCFENREAVGDISFEMNDGGNRFARNYNLKTSSMEIIVTTLIEKGIPQKTGDGVFIKAM
jgi:hypothetical protein